MSNENPRKWRFTWEAQSHSPTLKLFIFDTDTSPSIQCHDLEVKLNLSQSHVLVTWIQQQKEQQNQFSLSIPIPKVLIDTESPVSYRALIDHIEVKLVLLLPVDHPLVSRFDSVLRLNEDAEIAESNVAKPLVMDSDLKALSSNEGVHFYCRSCSTKLTRNPIRHFEEMPSVNWQDVADNWFGDCCCSFGGISHKLVTRYANSYICLTGMCLFTYTTVTLFKDDLVGCKFLDWDNDQKSHHEKDFFGGDGSNGAVVDPGIDHGASAGCDSGNNITHGFTGESELRSWKHGGFSTNLIQDNKEKANGILSESFEDEASAPGCCAHSCQTVDHVDEGCKRNVPESSTLDQKTFRTMELMTDQKSFLNGFLGNIFMARSSSLSKDIEWVEFLCPQCSSLVGAYPSCSGGHDPIDGGIRLFKCYISTSLPVGGSTDIFRKYTLERMFTNQLQESAKDELSFRTVIRDLKTKSPMLQIVLLNPNSWSSTGYCLGTAFCTTESISKLDLQPVIKVLFSDSSKIAESYSRMVEDWLTKNQADEVFMLKHQIEELIELLASAERMLPPSCTSIEGLHLSSIQR